MPEKKRREDANYKLVERKNTYAFADKRTGHRCIFTDCVPNGFKNNVFLRYLSPHERNEGHNATTGNRVAMLNKESLPEWIIDEFHSIRTNNKMTDATDPR